MAKKLKPGVNDLATINPKVADEWDYEANKGLIDEYGRDISTPDKVFPNSSAKVGWKITVPHPITSIPTVLKWESPISSRNRGICNCPYLSGRVLLKNFNDLETIRPDLAAQWHPTKNGSLTPSDVTLINTKKVWWQCEHGHEWKTRTSDRVRGTRCPYCAGAMAVYKETDLETVNPELAAQWHPTKNGDLKPSMVLPHSRKKVWWQCECGHEWSASVDSRTKGAKNCSICNKEPTECKTSFPEQATYYYVKKYFKDALNEDTVMLNGKELDIYIPNLEIGIEYDGYLYHQDIEKDIAKNKLAFKKGIYLIRIREKMCPILKDEHTEYILRNNNSDTDLENVIISLLIKLDVKNPDVNINRDYSEILNQIKINKKNRSLLKINPELAKDWHPTKNGNLTPDMVTYASNKKVWWLCNKCGHEWQATVSNRHFGRGCVACRKERKNSTPVLSIAK